MSTRLTLIPSTLRIRPANLILAALTIVVCFALAALAVNVRARFANTAPATTGGKQNEAQAQGTPTPTKIRGMLLTLRPYGFEPKQLRLSKRAFLLVVENRSGIREIVLRLDRVAGNRLREAPVDKRKQNWAEVVDLPPGNYKLSVAEHPDWVCDITIAPQ